MDELANDSDLVKLSNMDEFDEEAVAFDLPATGRSATVFLVDGNEAMYDNMGRAGCGVRLCLEACKESMRSICRKQRSDLAAVILFNVKETKGLHAPVNVVLLEELAVPKVKTIVNLNKIIEDDCREMKTTYGHSPTVSLHEVLRYAQQLILTSKIKSYVKHIVMFTCKDNPYPNNPSLELKARKQVEEFPEHDIDFDVVGLGDVFDSSKFYKELVLTARDELLKDWINVDPILKMDDVVTHINSFADKYVRRFTAINLSEDYQIHVALHKLYASPKPFKLKNKEIPKEETASEPVSSATSDVNEDDRELAVEQGNTVQIERDIKPPINAWWKSAHEGRGEQVAFIGRREVQISKAQLKEQMFSKCKGFELIAFVKSCKIPFYYTYGEPYVVIPSLNGKNNVSVFAQLLNKCLSEELSILCWFTLIEGFSPILCALHPTRQSEYAPGRVHPPCFITSKLWFADNIYEPDIDLPDFTNAVPSDDQLEAMKKIFEQTTLTYTVDKFYDVNSKHKTNLIEGLAFDADDVPETEDCTYLKHEELADDLARMVMDCSHLSSSSGVPKRKGAGSEDGGSRSSKSSKTDDDALEMIKNGLAHKLSVAQLKNLLSQAGVKYLSGAVKATLVEIAYQHFNK